MDARNSKPLPNLPVLIELGRTSNFQTQTNAFGYLFIPFEKALQAVEDTWLWWLVIEERILTLLGHGGK